MNDVLAPLDALSDIDAGTLARLHETLASRADVDHLLDVSYRTLDTPIGTLLLAATERGLVRVGFDVEGRDTVLEMLAAKVSPRILQAPKRLDPVARELDEYFAGTRRSFDVPLDWQLAHGFRLEVLRHLSEIGYGRTESYTEVATAAGSPRAVRAVGTACALNPLPVVVPCHRVVRSDGTPGNYRGGAPAKEILLGLESRRA
jgi:methylated-DNA-[protein]-cysteine S-methyltransferase